jgi:hypothetical protein
LLTGGSYLEVVIETGLTVTIFYDFQDVFLEF